MKDTKIFSNSIRLIFLGTLFSIAVLFVCFFTPERVYAADTMTGYVNASELNVRTKPGTTNSKIVGTLSYETVTILGSEKDSSGNLWYRISYNGGEYYIFAGYVTIQTNETESESSGYGTYKQQLKSFPVSYRSLIKKIHEEYPNYIFVADYVDFSFDEAVYQQTLDHRKLVSMSYDAVSWRSLSPDCYNRKTKKWSTYSGNWTDAGIDVIEYYMDPRNFLNTRNMFIFAQQTYTGAETKSGVKNIAGNSFLAGKYTDSTGTHSYIDTIMKVAKASKVSPYVIAATLRVEQPTSGQSPLIDGSYGYYNFFNFAASGSDVIGNGIAYAKKQGWDTVYKSILGGAQGYYNGYLKYGQDTYFYKDFNVVNGNFDHQYAQGVYDPIGSGIFLRNAIGDDKEATVVLRIPVYTEMPAEAPGYPAETSSLNPRYTKKGAVIARTSTTITTAKGSGSTTQTKTEPLTAEEPKNKDDDKNSGSSSGSGKNSGNSQTKASGNPKYKAGDANGDGKVSALDYIAVKNHIMKKKIISDADKLEAADANKDGKISALDYIRIKNKILKK